MLSTQVRRTFQKRRIQVIIIGIMIIMSSMMFSMMYFSVNSADDIVNDYYITQNQEDFSVNVSTMLTDKDVDYLNNKAIGCSDLTSISLWELMIENNDCYYQLTFHRETLIEENYSNLDVEYREIKKIKLDNGHQICLVGSEDDAKINIPYFENGTMPVNQNEIALTSQYLDHNDLDIGDTLTINNNEYTITANVLFPDITLGTFDGNLAPDQSILTFAYVPYEVFKDVIYFETLNVYYSADIGEYRAVSDEVSSYVDSFNDSLSQKEELDFVIDALKVTDTMRTGAFFKEIEGASNFSVFISTILSAIAVVVITIIIAQIIRKEKMQLGLLKALGFSKNKIIKPYIKLLGIYCLTMLVIGLIVGVFLAPMMISFISGFYILPTIEIAYTLSGVIIAVILPLFIILACSYILMNIMLRQEALEMINPQEKKLNIVVKTLSKKNSKDVRRKFKVMTTFSSLPKVSMYLFTIVAVSYMMLNAFSVQSNIKLMTESISYNEFEQSAYVNPAVTDIDALFDEISVNSEAEKAIELEVTVEDVGETKLLGLDNSSTLYEVVDNKGNSLSSNISGNEVIISYGYHRINGVDVGDKIVINLSVDKTIEVVVKDIAASHYVSETIFINRETLSNELTGSTNYYNKVFTNEFASLDDSTKFIGLITKDELIEMNEKMVGVKSAQFYAMIIFSFIFGCALLYIIISLIIEENFYNISLLKVLGFNRKEVNSIVLNGMFLLTILLFMISIPVALSLIKSSEQAMIEMGSFSPMTIKPIHILISLVLVVIVFVIVAKSASRKINKISLQESLKLYQD